MGDVQDLFIERIEGDTLPASRTSGGRWRRGPRRSSSRGATEPVSLEVRETHHGPIVNEALGADDAEPLALAWQTLREPTAFRGMFDLLDVTSGPELVELLEGHTSPPSNMIWADRHGSIGYKLIGRLPLRRGGVADLPKPGWTGEFEWEGTVPYEELPEVVDPESGFLVTANNRIVGDDYPHHITSEWLDGFRAKRIEELLEEREKHDLDGFAEMQTDVLSLPGPRGGAAALPPAARPASASAPRSSGCASGTAGSTPTPSPGRSTRPSSCGWPARWRARRSATATWSSAGSTAPTTASPRTSPHRGAGTRT